MMIRLMLVDDEPFILKGMRNMVQSLNLPVEIIGEAENGEQALVLMRQVPADIIILDIEMPVMDGFKLLEHISAEYPETKNIILSGHDDFEYARKSLKLHVNYYLLKPVMPEELKSVLLLLIDELEIKKDQMESAILSDVIINAAKDIRYDFPYNDFILFYICVGPMLGTNDFNSIDQHDLEMIIPARNVLGNLLHKDDKGWILNGRRPNEKILIIGLKHPLDGTERLLINKIIKYINLDCFPATMAIGTATGGLLSLPAEVFKLRKKIKEGMVIGKSQIFMPDDAIESENISILLPDGMKVMQLMVQNNNLNGFKKEFLRIMDLCAECDCTQKTVVKTAEKIFQILIQYSNNTSQSYFEEIEEILSTSMSLDDFTKGLMNKFEMFFPNNPEKVNNKYEQNEIADNIEKYMKQHISEAITLQMLSDKFSYSPAYICCVFKEIKGVPPLKYFTKLRMESAKELIRQQPAFKLKEVASILGFDDFSYFSRIFKKETGYNPTDFRDQQGV